MDKEENLPTIKTEDKSEISTDLLDYLDVSFRLAN